MSHSHSLHLAIFKNYMDLLCTYFCGFDFTFKFNRIQNLTQMCQRNVFLYPKLKIFVSLNLRLHSFAQFAYIVCQQIFQSCFNFALIDNNNMYIFHFKFYEHIMERNHLVCLLDKIAYSFYLQN